MAAQTKKTTIHGVEVTQVNYQGKWYTPVAARVQIAEQADPDAIRTDGRGYHVVSVQIIQMGDQWAYHCMVEYPIGSGVIRPGTDFIDMSDKKSGIAKAETSAIGRALGLHGIAIEEGIASAEEVRRSGGASSMPEMDEDERVVESPVTRRQPVQSTQSAVDHDAEYAAQPWPFIQDVEFRQAMNRRNIRDVAGVAAFVASASGKLHESVTYADRAICMEKATSLEGLAGKR